MAFRLNIILALVSVFFVSCSVTKYVPDSHYLLNKSIVEIDNDTSGINPNDMVPYIHQRSNSRWFSSLRIPLSLYSASGKDSTKFFNRLLRSLGEPPVLYDSLSTEATARDFKAYMQNLGFLKAKVDVGLAYKGKSVDVSYKLHPGTPYYLRTVDYDIRDSLIGGYLKNERALYNIIVPQSRFNINRLNEFRENISSRLRDNGYYKFNKNFISFVVDSIPYANEMDLTCVLHRYSNQFVVDTIHPRYRIRKVSFLTTSETGKMPIRNSVLLANTFVDPGNYFSEKKLQKTYNHYSRLQAIKYTNISFEEVPDSNMLDCNVLIVPSKRHSISFMPEGTNTAGDLGAAVSLSYTNRNLFRGSEVLNIELRGAFEAITGLEGYGNKNFEEYTIETNLTFPHFMTPFVSKEFRKRNMVVSEFSVLYDLQNRPEYHRRVLSMGLRYKWNDPNHHDKYQVDLLDLNYIFMPWISQKFKTDYLEDNSNRNAILRYNYEDLFIMKLGFGYSYNNGTNAIVAKVETAGNLLNLSSKLFDFSKNSLGQSKLFNIAFAQYVKADFDFTRHFHLDFNNSIVFHVGLGIAYPYGNSNILPFEKRYFSGGANSVRGWSVRELGPGKFKRANGDIDFINQTGDLKFDMNLEYRTHLFWKLNGALFIDTGNIWTLRSYKEQPGGKFRFDSFWKELAVAYGIGFRLNFDFFILRFDFGMKAVNPTYENKKEHFPLLYPVFSRDMCFHFAVGLPF